MTAIVFPVGSHPARRGHESAGRIVNGYAEPLGPGAVATAAIKRVPGLRQFADSGLTGYRGMILSGSSLFAAFEDEIVVVNAAGVVTAVDDLDGALPVQFAKNNKVPVADVVVVTENATFSVTTGGVTEIVDPELPAVISVTFQDGYFFFLAADKTLIASGLNDITINGLDNVKAEAKSGAGVRVVSFDQYLYAFCTTFTEVYSNTANPVGFPFSRIAVISRGLISPRGVTGFEDGFGKSLVWVGDDNGVHVLSGYQAQRISTPEVDRDIEAVAVKTDIEALCYVVGGQPMVAISAPEFTWEFNLATQEWHERESYLGPRWRGTANSQFAFQKWLVGDTDSGKILEVTNAVYGEVGEPLVWLVESAPSEGFPKGMHVPRADFNFAPGTGQANGLEPIATQPQVGIAWSDDGGLSWGNPLLREIGRQATNPGIRVNRTGLTGPQGRRWRLTVSDPVLVSLLGGDQAVEPR